LTVTGHLDHKEWVVELLYVETAFLNGDLVE